MGIRGMNRERLRLFNEALEVKHRAGKSREAVEAAYELAAGGGDDCFYTAGVRIRVWLEETYPLRKLIEMPWERQE